MPSTTTSTPNTRSEREAAVAVLEQAEQPVADWTDRDLDHLRDLVRAEEASAWEIGDVLLEHMPMGPVGVKTGVAAKIRQIAAEVDAEPKTLTLYRTVAHGWPDTTRVASATWAAHRAYMGPPSSAHARASTLLGLPRNEHGKITVQAVKALTRGAGRGKPGWHELLGEVSDTLTKADKQLARFKAAVGDRHPNAELRKKAGRYADQADRLAASLRDIANS
jgi:hypothetical protein